MFAVQSDPIDVRAPGVYSLEFDLGSDGVKANGELVDGFALKAPQNIGFNYHLGHMVRDDEHKTITIEMIVPEQPQLIPYADLTFWLY